MSGTLLEIIMKQLIPGIQFVDCTPDLYEEARKLPTEDLISLWKSWDGVAFLQPISAEEAYQVLCERGFDPFGPDLNP